MAKKKKPVWQEIQKSLEYLVKTSYHRLLCNFIKCRSQLEQVQTWLNLILKKDDNCNLLKCIINIKDNWNIKDNLKNREMEISSIILYFLWIVPLDNQIAEEGAEETPFWCSNSEKEMWSYHHFTTPSELLDLDVEHGLPLISQREMTKRVNASYQWKNSASCIVLPRDASGSSC